MRDIKLTLIRTFISIILFCNLLLAQDKLINIYNYLDIKVKLNQVFFTSNNIGWIIGDEGLIISTIDGGINWSKQYIDSKNALIDVFFLDDKRGWICSSDSLYKTINGGENWEFISDEFYFKSIIFLDTLVGWKTWGRAVYKTINGGVNWTLNFSTFHDFSELYFIDSENGYAVGTGGKIAQTKNGGATTWTYQYNSGLDNLNSLYFVNSSLGWAVGNNGRIIKIRSFSDYDVQISPNTTDLNSVVFRGSENGWAAGGNGSIIHTLNGGNHWSIVQSPTNSTLNSVIIDDVGYTWLVGDSSIITDKNIWDINQLKDTTLAIHQPFEINAYAKGIPVINYSFEQKPVNMQIDSISGKITWNCNTRGEHNIIINYSNGFLIKKNSFNISVVQPYIIFPHDSVISNGINYKSNLYVFGIYDERYKLINHPQEMTIDSISGQIKWNNTKVGKYNIKVEVSNYFTTIIDSFSILVYDQNITYTEIQDTNIVLGDSVIIQISARGFPEPNIELLEAPSQMRLSEDNHLLWQADLFGQHNIIWKAYNNFAEIVDTFIILVYSSSIKFVSLKDTSIVFGDSLIIQLNIVGFPKANLELLEAPSQMTLDDQNRLLWQTDSLGMHSIVLKAVNSFTEVVDSFNVLTYSSSIDINPISDTSMFIGDSININLKASGYPKPKIDVLQSPQNMIFNDNQNELDWIADLIGQYKIIWEASSDFTNIADTFIIMVTVEKFIPQLNIVMQNYPNPFNGNTKIIFDVKKKNLVQIEIYDVLGNQLEILVKKYYEAGRYEVLFEGANYASGIYYYKFKTGNYSSTKKMILLK